MKILFVMPTHISYGGIESVCLNLWKGLIQNGHHVDFVCHGYEIGCFEKEILKSNSNIYHIPIKGKDFKGTKREFCSIVEKGNYDVVHAHMNATCGIYLQMAKMYGVKVLVSHSHASSMKAITKNPLKVLINIIEKYRTNKYANIKIACSDKAGKWLYGNRSYIVVLNAVDAESFFFSSKIRKYKRNELNIAEDEFVAIHIGEFSKNKNQSFTIEVFRKIITQKKKSKLILVGMGATYNNIAQKVHKYGLQDHVMMLGMRNDVNKLLQAADVFLLPSFSEGNPVSLVEAVTAGIHCVVSDSISKTIAGYLGSDRISYLPIKGKDAINDWTKEILRPYKRIVYTKEKTYKLTIEAMTDQVEKMYVSTIMGERHEQ